MRVVVADTSPVNYLILVDCIDLLHRLYRRIIVPTEVYEELTSAGAPATVSGWIRNRPDWIEVRSRPVESSVRAAHSEAHLDAGERAAIQLAQTKNDALLLIDEAAGRSAASQLGIPNTGTLGILREGAKTGLVDLETSLARLLKTNFRISQSLIDQLLK